jgi:hypothetical protein
MVFQAIAVFGAAESADPEMKRIPEQTLFLGRSQHLSIWPPFVRRSL